MSGAAAVEVEVGRETGRSGPRAASGRRRLLGILLSVVLALGLLVAVVAVVGGEETARALVRAGPVPFLAIGAVQAVILALQTAAWSRVCLSLGLRVPLRVLAAGNLLGQAVNILTPSAYLGGEPARVLAVGRATGGEYGRVTGSVVLYKVHELRSFVAVYGLAALAAGIGYRATLFGGVHTAIGVLLVVTAGLLFGLGLAVATALRRGAHPLTGVLGAAGRIAPRWGTLRRLRERCRTMEEGVIRAFVRDPGRTRQAVALLVTAHVLMLLRPGVFFILGSGPELGLRELGLLFVVGQALLVAQLTPSSVGSLDAGFLAACSVVGLPAADGLAFLLCVRLWDAATVGAAAWVGARAGIAWLGAGRAASGKEEPDRAESPGG